MTKELLGILSVLFAFMNAVLYLRTVFAGKTRPHAFTWGVWCLISGVIFAVQVAEGAGSGAWLQAFNIISCGFIMVMGITRGDRDYTRRDWAALALSIFSIPLWLMMGDPLLSVLLLCAIDAVAFLPTIRKSWHKPYEEPALPYTLWGMSSVLSVASIESYSWQTIFYPAFLAALNFVFTAMLLARRRG
jgi:hypothetical protein